MKFLQGEAFTTSLRDLYQKGGKYQNAAKTVQSIWGRAKLADATFEETFKGVPATNHGESRIPHCRKYDLTGFARLVTVVNNGLCIFLFAGDHDATDNWLERNKGLDFAAKTQGQRVVLEQVRVSDVGAGSNGRIAAESDFSQGPLVKFLPTRYQERIFSGLPSALQQSLSGLESVASDDLILDLASRCGAQGQQDAVMDVLLSLRSGDIANAKNRIDLFTEGLTPVNQLPAKEVNALSSSEAAVLLTDVDAELFQHFVQTASFEKWMLYLHPAQREHVSRSFKSSARLAGVSGSGKTCVVVHRALRLADQHCHEPVLIVTLNEALATLINRLIDAHRGTTRPGNLTVKSIFELCFDNLMEVEAHKRDYYTKRSVAKNPHAVSEHIDEVWREYFLCENNNRAADAVLEVIRLLNVRGIYASDYLRQEFDYIRSSFPPDKRPDYLKTERVGRIVPLEERFRQNVLDALAGWEQKMEAVGVIDDMGIVASLYRHVTTLKPHYRCTLVDEAQDLGTLELAVIRKLTHEGDDDLFICGDSAQTVYTKSVDLKAAGIDIAGRSARLNRNYRNSRQILTAAHQVLTRAIETMPKGAVNIEIHTPEFANFASPKPLLLKAQSLEEEISRGIGYLTYCAENEPTNQRYCLALCGFSQASVEQLAAQVSLPALAKDTDIGTGRIFVSDLEQTKGFEFDAVVVVNCSDGVVPHPNLPAEESFRDLCKLYVAMTRAKTQLVLSYTGEPSAFVQAARETFVEADFSEYAEVATLPSGQLPEPVIPRLMDPEIWGRSGIPFLKSRDAVGLTSAVQDEIIEHVSGRELMRSRKQMEWKTFGTFARAMNDPRSRHQVLSPEAWTTLSAHLAKLRVATKIKTTEPEITSAADSSPHNAPRPASPLRLPNDS
jgi:hypothetical protein